MVFMNMILEYMKKISHYNKEHVLSEKKITQVLSDRLITED